MTTFSTNLETILAQYFPGNTAPTGLQAKIDAVYDSSSNLGAFDLTSTKPKYSNKQVDVTFNDQDFEYKIVYNDGSVKTKTFYGSIPDGVYANSTALYEAVEHAFQEAVFLEKDGTRKNLTDHLGFNAKWKIVSGDLKLLIPSTVSNFVISELKYKHVVNHNDIINLANDADLISTVIATWNGDLASIPTGGLALGLNVSSATVQNNGKIYFKDVSGDYYFSTIANGTNTTVDALVDVFEAAGATAYYRDSSDNKQFTSSAIQLTFNAADNTLAFADAATKKISEFVAVNQNAYEIYKITDETGLLSGMELSQLDVDNRTGNFGGDVIIDATHKQLKYEVVYIDENKAEQVFVNTAVLSVATYSDLSGLAAEIQTQLNAGLAAEKLGAWQVTVNKIKDASNNLIDTNNLKVVYNANASAGAAGVIDASNNLTIKRVHFVPVANDAYQQVKIQGEIYNDVKIKRNIVYNKTGVIKALPDAGLAVSGTIQYQIIYTDASNNNTNHNDIKTATVATATYKTVEDLATAIQTGLNAQDAGSRWAVSWNQSTQKFDITYNPNTGASNTRTNVQIKFLQNTLSTTLGISQVLYTTTSNSTITIDTNQFIQSYVTIPANAGIAIHVNGVMDLSTAIVSKSYLSGDELATAVNEGNLLAYWKEDHLELAWNKATQATTDIVTVKATVNAVESAALRNLLKFGGKFFEPNGVNGNTSSALDLWKAVQETTHSVRIVVPNIVDLFPDASANIINRFFADASDNILDIYRLTNGLKDVIVENVISYKKALGLTGGSHVENDYADSQDNLRIRVFLGGATAGSQMYTVNTSSIDLAPRIYDIYVTPNEFSHIGVGATAEQGLIQNMIEKTYDTDFYEMIRDNVEVKTKELVEFILHEWIVAVNNDPQSSEYLTGNVLADLKDQVLSKIAPESGSVFSLLSAQEYTTLVQAFQTVLPEANGSSYIALRTLENNDYLADPLEIYNALRKDNVNIYDILGIDNKTAQVEEFLKEYYDRLLRAYAELVRQKLLPGGTVAFKPSNLAVALAASVELNIGAKGTIAQPANMNEYFNSISLANNAVSAKFSDLVNAIAHNIYNNASGRKTSTQLLTGIMIQPVSNPLAHTITLLNTVRNEEHESTVHNSGVARTKGLGLQYNSEVENTVTVGHRYLTAIMMSHHLLHKILADGSGSLFNVDSAVTEARWERLMLAYEQEGRCLPVDFFEKVDYTDVVNVVGASVIKRFERLADSLFITMNGNPTVDVDINNIGNLHAYLNRLFKQIDIKNGDATGAEFTVVAVSGEVEVDATNNGQYLLVGKHKNEGKIEGLLRYYIDTLYNFIALEGATAPAQVVIPFYKQAGDTNIAKGLTHSLFYRLAIDNNFEDILRTLGNHYSTAKDGSDYFENLDGVSVIPSGGLVQPLADVSMNIHSESLTREQINEAVLQRNTLLATMNNKMRTRIFGTTLAEDPGVGRTTMSATPEMQAQVNQMKFFEAYIQRFSDIDQGLLLGLLVQYDKRIEQQERTTSPTNVKMSASEYLNEIHRYLSEIVAKRHMTEAQFGALLPPYEEDSADRTLDSRSIISSVSSGGNDLTKAHDVIVLGQIFEIMRDPAVDLWKNDILAAINIENVRYNLESGSPNDISEFLNMYEKAVNEMENCITSVVNNQAVVERTLQLLTTGLSGTTEQRILAIEEATREAAALECSKVMLDSLVVIIGILNVKIEQLVAAQQELDVKISSYNRLVTILQSQITDLQNVYAALPPQYNNFSELAQTLSECLTLALKKRDEVSGKISQLRLFLDNAKLAYNIQKDYKINKVVLPDQLGRGFNFSTVQSGLFQ